MATTATNPLDHLRKYSTYGSRTGGSQRGALVEVLPLTTPTV